MNNNNLIESVSKISSEIVFTNSNYDLIKCDKLAKTKHIYKLGDSMVVDHDEFVRRFNLVTNNMMLGDFPWDVAVVAGGMISLLLDVNFDEELVKSSDIDIFIIGKDVESKKESFKRVLDWFDKSGRTVYSVVGSVCNVYVPKVDNKNKLTELNDLSKTELTNSSIVINTPIGADRYFQLISNNADKYQDVITNFDLAHIQVCYNGVEVYATHNAIKAMMTRTTVLLNSKRTNINRMLKSLYRGWNIQKDAILTNYCPELEYYSNNPSDDKVLSNINNMHRYNYPHVSTNITEDEKNILIDVMDKYTCGHMITMSSAKVLDSIVIGGKFETSYMITRFENFKLDSVDKMPYNIPNHLINIPYHLSSIKSNRIINIMTDLCKIIDIGIHHVGAQEFSDRPAIDSYDIVYIKLQVLSEELKNFMEMMDTKVVEHITKKLYKNNTKKILLNNSNIFKIKFSTRKTIFRETHLRNSNNETLHICDFKMNDLVKLVFKPEFIANSNSVKFNQLQRVTYTPDIYTNSNKSIDIDDNNFLNHWEYVENHNYFILEPYLLIKDDYNSIIPELSQYKTKILLDEKHKGKMKELVYKKNILS